MGNNGIHWIKPFLKQVIPLEFDLNQPINSIFTYIGLNFLSLVVQRFLIDICTYALTEQFIFYELTAKKNQGMCTKMFIVALFVISEKLETT